MPFEVRKLRSCCFCVSQRIELVIWASINLSFHAFFLLLISFLIIVLSDFGGGLKSIRLEELTLPSALLIEVIYNILVIVGCLRKHVKLLKFSLVLGVLLWITLIAFGSWWFATIIPDIPKPDSWLKTIEIDLGVFVVLIILQGYMLLIMCSVILRLQDESRRNGYHDLDKTIEVGADYERPSPSFA